MIIGDGAEGLQQRLPLSCDDRTVQFGLCQVSLKRGLLFITCWLGLLSAPTVYAVDAQDFENYRDWGLEIATTTDADLRRNYIYAEKANLNGDQFGGINGNAFIWPASVQFRVLNSRFALDPTPTHRSSLLGMSDELHQRYWLNSSDGENGYVVAPGSNERYYDDNAHMTVALMEAYELTGEQRLLDRAIATHDFVLEGEDNFQDGGIYFREGSFGNKNTISTLQEARGAAMIYQATNEQRFLDDATRLLEWSNSHVRRSDGLYYQSYRDENIDDISNIPLTNGVGMGITTNLEMYDITGDEAYLTEAQRSAARASRVFQNRDTGSLGGGGYWAFELLDAWVDLYHHSGSRRWLSIAARSLEFLKDNIEDDNGHYGGDWHTVSDDTWPELNEWSLIDQAAAARAFLYTGIAVRPLPGDYNNDGTVDAADYTVWRDGFGTTYTQEDYSVWVDNYGNSAATSATAASQSSTVPEPSAGYLLMLMAICAGSWSPRSRS